MRTIIIDTNGFLRLFLDDIPEQADQIMQLIQKAKRGYITIVVPDIILFEIHFILQKFYKVEKQEIIEKLKSLVSSSYLIIESRTLFSKALMLYEKNNISFVDSFLLTKAQDEKAQLFTFDKKLAKLR